MKVGPPLQSEIYNDWRFVEADLFGISERVTEYDSDARLVIEEGTRRLGLARWVKAGAFTAGGVWLLACRLSDPETEAPLVGEPDGRVLVDQRRRDYFRITNEMAWRRAEKAEWLKELKARHRYQDRDRLGEEAERFVHEHRKSRNLTQDRVFIGG